MARKRKKKTTPALSRAPIAVKAWDVAEGGRSVIVDAERVVKSITAIVECLRLQLIELSKAPGVQQGEIDGIERSIQNIERLRDEYQEIVASTSEAVAKIEAHAEEGVIRGD